MIAHGHLEKQNLFSHVEEIMSEQSERAKGFLTLEEKCCISLRTAM